MMYREGKVFGLISGSDLPGPVSIGLRRGRLTGVCTSVPLESGRTSRNPPLTPHGPETLDRRLS